MKKTLTFLLAVTLMGCGTAVRDDSNADAYQFGDLTKAALAKTREIVELRAEYCATEDPIIRQAAIELIQNIAPDYPEKGICLGLEDAIAEITKIENR